MTGPATRSPRRARYGLRPTWRVALAATIAAVLGSACGAASLFPIVDAEETEFDSLLLGTWTDSAGDETAIIDGHPRTGFTVTYVDEEGEVNRFEGSLGRLGSRRILQLLPVETDYGGDFQQSLVQRLYAFVEISRVTERDMHFRLLEPDSLRFYLDRNPTATPYALLFEDRVLLTARTPELRTFLVRYTGLRGVWGDTTKWVRARPEPRNP